LNNKGEYFSVGVMAGKYTVSLVRNGQALDTFQSVPVQANPDGMIINFDLAKDLKASGVSEEQQKKIDEVNKTNEKIKGLNAQLAQARDLEKAGNYDQAIQLLQQATQADPTKDLLWAYLGDAYLKGKKYPEAADAYQKAIAITPTKGGYHAGLADAYAKSSPPQMDKAIAEYKAAADAEPANAAMYYFNEGALFTNTGKVNDAIAAFDKTIELDPNRADAYYWKGVNMMANATTAKDGKFIAPPGTAEAFQKYLELKPDGPLAQPAKDMLASMGSSVETTFGKQKTAKTAPPKK
jgi:tetratricopeptide (TPR) repeat protein